MRAHFLLGVISVLWTFAHAQSPLNSDQIPIQKSDLAIVPMEISAPDPAALALRESQSKALASYIDGLVHGLKKRDALAGITIGVARKEGDLFLAGYGMATQTNQSNALAQITPVDSAQTMFRLGSTSKLMTYLSAMQLVEQGRLNLDAPVNSVLPAELAIPEQGYTRAIVVRDLLHHTAGFEDLALGHLFVDAPEKVLSLKDYLSKYRPKRVREAGTAAVYSNYSVALLGQVIAHVSGESYEAYVDKHIFQPLQMTQSSFREPDLNDARKLDANLQKKYASGFVRSQGGFDTQKFEYIAQVAPAGGMASTAADMLRFGRMLINDGELDGVRVVSKATLDAMRAGCYHNGAVANDQLKVQGICHGFMTRTFGAHQAYGHGGATVFQHTAFLTIPSADLVVFVSSNTDNARKTSADLADFIVEFLTSDGKRTQLLRPAVSVSESETNQIVGDYITNRRPFSGLTALLTVLSSDAVVKADARFPKGSIIIGAGDDAAALVPIAPLTYQNPENANIIKFITNTKGEVSGFAGSAGHTTASKPSGLTHPLVWLSLTGLLTPFCVFTLISAYAGTHTQRRPSLKAVRWLSVLISLVALVMLVCFGVMAGELSNGGSALFSYPTSSAQYFAYCAIALAALSVIKLLCVPAVLKSDWRWLAKLGFLLSALIFSSWTISSYSWGLLSTNVTEVRQ
jgi:CubicO group peptidase (beta-lactamase class C family)